MVCLLDNAKVGVSLCELFEDTVTLVHDMLCSGRSNQDYRRRNNDQELMIALLHPRAEFHNEDIKDHEFDDTGYVNRYVSVGSYETQARMIPAREALRRVPRLEQRREEAASRSAVDDSQEGRSFAGFAGLGDIPREPPQLPAPRPRRQASD